MILSLLNPTTENRISTFFSLYFINFSNSINKVFSIIPQSSNSKKIRLSGRGGGGGNPKGGVLKSRRRNPSGCLYIGGCIISGGGGGVYWYLKLLRLFFHCFTCLGILNLEAIYFFLHEVIRKLCRCSLSHGKSLNLSRVRYFSTDQYAR